MALVVTGVGSVIHVYSIGYMKDDTSYARFFAYLNLFLFFMLLLVLGRSLLGALRRLGRRGPCLLPADRLLVRATSPTRAPARRRSSPTASATPASCSACSCSTRRSARSTWTASTPRSMARPLPAVSASLVGMLLFIGATRQSRRRSRCTSGCPTPWPARRRSRALIHAATMVTAGVYLVARMSGDLSARARGVAR